MEKGAGSTPAGGVKGGWLNWESRGLQNHRLQFRQAMTGCGVVGSMPRLGRGGQRFDPSHPDS